MDKPGILLVAWLLVSPIVALLILSNIGSPPDKDSNRRRIF
ncbi:MAG: hypothetical protein ACXW48_23060 [Candidatus Binatia bacterium]